MGVETSATMTCFPRTSPSPRQQPFSARTASGIGAAPGYAAVELVATAKPPAAATQSFEIVMRISG
jgi:hypothetical protein